jgi:hypothetical protein
LINGRLAAASKRTNSLFQIYALLQKCVFFCASNNVFLPPLKKLFTIIIINIIAVGKRKRQNCNMLARHPRGIFSVKAEESAN